MASSNVLESRIKSDVANPQKLSHCKLPNVRLVEEFLAEQKNLCEYIVCHVDDFVTEIANESNVMYCVMDIDNPRFNKVSASSTFSYMDLINGIGSPYNFKSIHIMLYEMLKPIVPQGCGFETFTHIGDNLNLKLMLSLRLF